MTRSLGRSKVLKWVLGVLVALFLIGQFADDEPADDADAASRPASDTTTTAPTTTTATPKTSTPKPQPTPGRTTTTRKPRDVYRVTDVVDGDTVKVTRAAGGGVVTVRVLGIDTPETRDPRRGVGCYGPEASAWATRTLLGKQVRIRTDHTQDTRDRYGRLLAYVMLPGGKDYSTVAARAGYARYYLYGTPVARAAQIQAAERAARSAGRGLWGAPCYGDTDAARTQPPAPQAGTDAARSSYYQNCDAARAAGAAPVRRGDPGYGSHLDRDDDGVACE